MRVGICVAIILLIISCKKEKSTPPRVEVKKNVTVPAFNADSAYMYIEKQLSFGPRIPGTKGHKECKEWIVSQMKLYSDKVSTQDFKASFQELKGVPSSNIIAQINPNHPKRLLLSAHWDTRAISDAEEDPTLKSKPVPGADDGGSGVSILIEVARVIHENPIDMGVDFVFFDAEDQGDSGDPCLRGSACSWGQGSQYWAKNLIPKDYKPEYGILFDMVGAKNASFYKEGYSRLYAGPQTDKIWTLAQRMGYGDFFIDQAHGPITDDHRFVNEISGIPMLDIVNLKHDVPSKTFQKCWHTQCDDISVIDKRTLRVVGQVTLAVLYKESGNTI